MTLYSHSGAKPLSISMDYMERDGVLDWVLTYLKQNDISFEVKTVQYNGAEVERMFIKFTSYNQREVFLFKGIGVYPYFDFL